MASFFYSHKARREDIGINYKIVDNDDNDDDEKARLT